MKKLLLSIFVIALVGISSNNTFGQYDYDQVLGQELNAITTSVPFLMIAPDSRSGSMGDAGVATSPDGYSQHWNSSKYAFIDQSAGFTLSYTPWLKDLVDDMSLAYLTGYYRLDKLQTLAFSLRYFTMGNITFTDENGDAWGNYSPNEFAVDGSYNRKLSEKFALGLAGRFIYSNLTGGQGGTDGNQAGTSFAIDVNGFYTDKMKLAGYDGNWSAGFNMSNIGAKLGYTDDTKNFIPTNLRLGGAMTLDLDDYNSISTTLDINKLLVPTPPVYYSDSVDGNGEKVIFAGLPNDVGIAQGMVQSFYDAPRGFEEEMEEISIAFGLEYWYAKQFAVRAGYFYEHQNKGNRKYFTAGVGLKMNVFGLDFSYLIPAGNFTNSPLANTWRFSLIFDLDNFNNQ